MNDGDAHQNHFSARSAGGNKGGTKSYTGAQLGVAGTWGHGSNQVKHRLGNHGGVMGGGSQFSIGL